MQTRRSVSRNKEGEHILTILGWQLCALARAVVLGSWNPTGYSYLDVADRRKRISRSGSSSSRRILGVCARCRMAGTPHCDVAQTKLGRCFGSMYLFVHDLLVSASSRTNGYAGWPTGASVDRARCSGPYPGTLCLRAGDQEPGRRLEPKRRY
jgi:hypothetical protein